MGIMRIGHVNMRVMDMTAALDHYTRVLGLTVTHRDEDGTAYLKCWDEWDKYSLILSSSDRPGLDYLAYKVEHDSDLDRLAGRIRAMGRSVEEVQEGDIPFCGRAIRFKLPTDHTMVLFAQKVQVGRDTGSVNPEPWPEGKTGIAVHWLDHVALIGEVNPEAGVNRVQEGYEFLTETLEFHLSERLMVGPEYSIMAGAFMFRATKPHDIAILSGPTNGFHHLSYFLDDWKDVLVAGDILARNKVRLEITPTRHGITRGETIYFFDPSGNRNETFAGLGYLAQPDMPVITWTEEDIPRGVFYHTGEMIESFQTAYTT